MVELITIGRPMQTVISCHRVIKDTCYVYSPDQKSNIFPQGRWYST